jgi:hypothetical protein
VVTVTLDRLVVQVDGSTGPLACTGPASVEPVPVGVVAATLTPALSEFVTSWRRTRPMRGSGFRKAEPGDIEPVSPLTWLVTETALERKDITSAFRFEANGTVTARGETVDLNVADALVAAIGEPGMFHDGTLAVRETPRNCCGSSRAST